MSTDTCIGYYVHHHGRGHLMRALSIIRHIPCTVVLFGSFSNIDIELPDNALYIELPDDTVAGYTPTLGRPFLYTPRNEQILQRYEILLGAIRTYGIQHMHVDVSPEILAYSKLFGMTTSTILMQGIRTDPAHTLQYALADTIICPATAEYIDLHNYNLDKEVQFTGGISRLSGRTSTQVSVRTTKTSATRKQIVCTTSFGGESKSLRPYIAAATALPEHTWHILGNYIDTQQLPDNLIAHSFVADPYELIMAADYIIGSGGYNSIMEAASLSKKYACQAESRPFDEQVVAAKRLAAQHMAISIPELPSDRAAWTALLVAMDELDTQKFASLVEPNAADNAAQAIYAAASR